MKVRELVVIDEITREFQVESDEAVNMILDGMPERGNVSRGVMEKLIRATFVGGVVAARAKAAKP